MSDQSDVEPDVDPVAEPDDERADGPEPTGHPAVDEVLRSLEDLESRPVDEHVAAFEEAHDRLRRALSDAGDEATRSGG